MPHFQHYPTPEPGAAPRAPKQLGEQPLFHEGVFVWDSHVGPWTEIGPKSWIGESVFSDYSYCAGDNQIIYSDVGKFCSIASHVRINPGNHPMGRVTQHHMTYRRRMFGFGEDDAAFFEWRRADRCVVGHDVWLGHGVIVMPGVTIGTGAVVGAGAVVTKDIPAYAVAVGVPAKPIRQRFDDATVAALLAIAWWDWERAKLEAHFDDLFDVPSFIARHGTG